MKNLRLFFAVAIALTGCRQSFSPYLEKAQNAYDQKNYINTIDALNVGLPKWRESDGNDKKAQAYQLLGQSYHELRNTDKAIEAYQQAIKLSDKTFDSAYALGMLHLAKNQPDLAQKYFLVALRMKPNDPMALLGLGNSLFAQKRPGEAVIAFDKVLDNSPGVREAMESLSLIKGSHKKSNTSKPAVKKKAPAKKNSSFKMH